MSELEEHLKEIADELLAIVAEAAFEIASETNVTVREMSVAMLTMLRDTAQGLLDDIEGEVKDDE